jgi:integrase
MAVSAIPKGRGRPRRYAEYEELLASLPPKMAKRPKYANGIGLFRGERDVTVWIKLTLPKGGLYKGRTYAQGEAAEIKLGKLSSWTWEQVEAERNELVGRAERGEALEEAPVVTFRVFAADWFASRQGSVKGWAVERGHLQNTLLPTFGNTDLKAITFADVNRWQANQLQAFAPATVQRQLTTLKTILNSAVKAGALQRNPCQHAHKIRGIEPRQRYLELDEARRLLTVAATLADWLPDFLLWLLHSGMRRGEVLALTWQDIRRTGDDLTMVSIRKTKTSKPRYITCNMTMCAVLQRCHERRPDCDRPFPISLTTLKRKMKQLLERTGIEDVHLHDLRRTNATYLARAGVDLRTLSGRIGHSDLTMMQNVYSVFVEDQNAADAAQKVFGDLQSRPAIEGRVQPTSGN